MRKWLQKIGLVAGIWTVFRAIWEAVSHWGNVQTVWDIVKDWPSILRGTALIVGSWWFPLVISLLALALWFYVTYKATGQKRATMKIPAVPEGFATGPSRVPMPNVVMRPLFSESDFTQIIRRADSNVATIDRRATEVETTITGNLPIVALSERLGIEPELTNQISNAPKAIERIEPELIDAAYLIDREMTWQTFRDLGIAVVALNKSIAKFNEAPTQHLCHRMLGEIEDIRKLKVNFDRERTSHL